VQPTSEEPSAQPTFLPTIASENLIPITSQSLATLGPQTIVPVTYATAYPTAVPTIKYYNMPTQIQVMDDTSPAFEILRRRFGKVEITVKWTVVQNAKFYIVMQVSRSLSVSYIHAIRSVSTYAANCPA
jgi:hypothetical protein